MKDKSTIKNIALEVFEIESQSIANLQRTLDDNFADAILAIINSPGKVIVTGIGKSGHIGRKIAATLASTGTPSFFVHPGEAFHGDLGMFEKDDIVIVISNSGETDEVLRLIPFFKQNGNKIIGMSGKPDSTLGRNSDFHLNVYVEKEACPLEMAPTSSTAAVLAMGDAIAVALMKSQGFKQEEFARFHPGGSLGRRLLVRAQDIMVKDNLPLILDDCSMVDLIHIMTRGRLGLAVIVDDANKISGIITDGDLRRAMEKNQNKFFTLIARDFMTLQPKAVTPDTKLFDIQNIMQQHKIDSLLVADDNELVGVVQIFDIK